jgi:hypothetical protein
MEAGYAVESDAQIMVHSKKTSLLDRLIPIKFTWKKDNDIEQYQKREAMRMNTLVGAKISRDSDRGIDQPERAIQFTVYQANGGRVIETRRYDRQKDRHTNGLYVITSEMDFGREIDKIITMEALKQ